MRSQFDSVPWHKMKEWFLYLVRCSDGTIYTGITVDLEKRIEMHNKGVGAKSLMGKRPVKLVHFEKFGNRSEASKREAEIKKFRREDKLKLFS